MNAILENLMPKVPETFEVLNGLKIDQIAISTTNAEDLLESLRLLGLKEWTFDEVVAEGTVRGVEGKNTAMLAFNYQMNIEFEVLQYTKGASWHDEVRGLRLENDIWKAKETGNILSHIGYHLHDNKETGQTGEEKLQEIKEKMLKAGYKVAQEVWTLSHTNEYLLQQKRKYHYIIFDSRKELGFDIKLIVRRENENM